MHDFRSLTRRFGADVALEMFADVFTRRLGTNEFKVTRALEQQFDDQQTDLQRQIKADIHAFLRQSETKQDLFMRPKELPVAHGDAAASWTMHAGPESRFRLEMDPDLAK